MPCPHCGDPIEAGQPYVTIGDTSYHAAFVEQPIDADGNAVGEPITRYPDCVPPSGATQEAPPNGAGLRYILSVLEFTSGRFTQAERERIGLAMELHPDPQTRVRLKLLDKDVQNAKNKEVDVRDPRTQMGVGYLTTVTYDGAPLLQPSRVAQILAPA